MSSSVASQSSHREDDAASATTSNLQAAAGMRTPTRQSSTARDGDDSNNDNDNNMILPPTPDSEMSTFGHSPAVSPVTAAREEPVVPPTPANHGKDDDDDDDVESIRSELTPISMLRGPVVDQNDINERNDDDEDNNDVNVDRQQVPPPPEEPEEDEWAGTAAHIRGTDIHVPTAAAAFADFLRNFVSLSHARRRQKQQEQQRRHGDSSNNNSDDDESSVDSSLMEEDHDEAPFYLNKLDALIQRGTLSGTASLDIDTQHLYFYSEASQRLYYQLVAYPLEVVPLMDLVVQREIQGRIERLAQDQEDYTALLRLQVRPFNLKDTCNLRELDPVAMDSLVSIKGMIVRTSPVIPDLKVAYFGCVICGHGQQVTIDRGRIAEPTGACPVCQTKNSHSLVHNRSVFADKQLVRLQETPDKVPAGQTPASVLTFCFDDLVDAVQPGDKVEVTGVLRAQPVRVHPRMSTLKSIYKTYIDVIHYRTVNGLGTKAATGRTKTEFSPARVEQLKALSQRPDIYDQLTSSLAPSIWELDDVKKGVLCMLVGGNHGDGPTANAGQEEGEIGWTKTKRRMIRGDDVTKKEQILIYYCAGIREHRSHNFFRTCTNSVHGEYIRREKDPPRWD